MPTTYILEPNCRHFSHESINSVYVKRHIDRSFSNSNDVKFYCFESHLNCLDLPKSFFTDKRIDAVFWPTASSPGLSSFNQFFVLFKAYNIALNARAGDHLVLLSCSNFQLFFLYYIVFLFKPYVYLSFYLHSNFDPLYGVSTQITLPTQSLSSKAKFLVKQVLIHLKKFRSSFAKLSNFTFLLPRSSRISFLLLSDHIIQYLPPRLLANHSIKADNLLLDRRLPPFSPFNDGTSSTLTVATLGYGNPCELNKLVQSLESLDISNITLMIIGGNPNSIRKSSLISYYPPKTPLSRDQMTSLISSVDIVLVLQKRDTRFVCSGAPLEAISYSKPILYLGDVCTESILYRNGIYGLPFSDFTSLSRELKTLAVRESFIVFYRHFLSSLC